MQKQTIFKIYTIAIIFTIILFVVFYFLNQQYTGSFWQTMQQSKSALTAEYCELDQPTHLFRQTVNTYSNLAYFFLGIIVVSIAFFDFKNTNDSTKNAVQQFPLLSFFFGSCLIYLCFGSAYFHASLTWVGQRIDMNATYSICISLMAISSYRFFYKKKLKQKNQFLIILGLIILVAIFVELHLWISSLFLLPFLILIIIVFTTINYSKNKSGFKSQFAILSLIIMIAANILRTLDVKKIACNPTSIYQGHAIWHFFTGMSAFLLYWFYRSEKVKTV